MFVRDMQRVEPRLSCLGAVQGGEMKLRSGRKAIR